MALGTPLGYPARPVGHRRRGDDRCRAGHRRHDHRSDDRVAARLAPARLRRAASLSLPMTAAYLTVQAITSWSWKAALAAP